MLYRGDPNGKKILVEESHPDLVIMDSAMPRVGGPRRRDRSVATTWLTSVRV